MLHFYFLTCSFHRWDFYVKVQRKELWLHQHNTQSANTLGQMDKYWVFGLSSHFIWQLDCGFVTDLNIRSYAQLLVVCLKSVSFKGCNILAEFNMNTLFTSICNFFFSQQVSWKFKSPSLTCQCLEWLLCKNCRVWILVFVYKGFSFCRLWDIECGACLRVLEGHEELVRCIRFDNKRIVSGAYDG